jgi:hypothetical protein
MGHGELNEFAKPMMATYSPSEHPLLAANFHVLPHGEKIPINTLQGQETVARLIEAIEPDGLMIDSVGSSVQGSISNEENIQDLVDFFDRIRKHYGVFIWNIHHMRKSQGRGHIPTEQDDIYGNQYIFNRSTSCYGLFWAKKGNILLRNLKQRHAKKEPDHYFDRTEDYNFRRVKQIVDTQLTDIKYKRTDEEKGPEQHGNFQL